MLMMRCLTGARAACIGHAEGGCALRAPAKSFMNPRAGICQKGRDAGLCGGSVQQVQVEG